MTNNKIRNLYTGRKKVVTVNKEKTRTQQQFADSQNINNIMGKFKRTGILGNPLQAGQRNAQFGDFSSGADFLEAQNTIIRAQESFMDLPSSIRKRFSNNPAELLTFLNDEKNLEEAQQLGLVEKPDEIPPKTEPVEPVEPVE